MREDFLHYVWKFLKFDTRNLRTIQKETVTIENVGQHNFQSGPDFFNALLHIGTQKWAGNVEIHIKSSDWYAHQHETNQAYDSVILHVVWEYDMPIYRKDDTEIPTIELKGIISKEALLGYDKLFHKPKKWINCEEQFPEIAPFLVQNWIERLFFERLQEKSEQILEELKSIENDWEAILFRMLAKGFGLKVNGTSFLSVAKSVDFSVIKKCAQKELVLEALLFGQAGLLKGTNESNHFKMLKSEYRFLKKKFQLTKKGVSTPQFFRLRPPNFPTIRLSQLASLYTKKGTLFSELMEIDELDKFYELMSASASTYWERHFNFNIESNFRRKGLTRKFIDLQLINIILPLKFCYASSQGIDLTDEIIKLASQITKENNTIISKFNVLQPIAENAMQTQGLLQLKDKYCDPLRCMQCEIGNNILKQA